MTENQNPWEGLLDNDVHFDNYDLNSIPVGDFSSKQFSNQIILFVKEKLSKLGYNNEFDENNNNIVLISKLIDDFTESNKLFEQLLQRYRNLKNNSKGKNDSSISYPDHNKTNINEEFVMQWKQKYFELFEERNNLDTEFQLLKKTSDEAITDMKFMIRSHKMRSQRLEIALSKSLFYLGKLAKKKSKYFGNIKFEAFIKNTAVDDLEDNLRLSNNGIDAFVIKSDQRMDTYKDIVDKLRIEIINLKHRLKELDEYKIRNDQLKVSEKCELDEQRATISSPERCLSSTITPLSCSFSSSSANMFASIDEKKGYSITPEKLCKKKEYNYAEEDWKSVKRYNINLTSEDLKTSFSRLLNPDINCESQTLSGTLSKKLRESKDNSENPKDLLELDKIKSINDALIHSRIMTDSEFNKILDGSKNIFLDALNPVPENLIEKGISTEGNTTNDRIVPLEASRTHKYCNDEKITINNKSCINDGSSILEPSLNYVKILNERLLSQVNLKNCELISLRQQNNQVISEFESINEKLKIQSEELKSKDKEITILRSTIMTMKKKLIIMRQLAEEGSKSSLENKQLIDELNKEKEQLKKLRCLKSTQSEEIV